MAKIASMVFSEISHFSRIPFEDPISQVDMDRFQQMNGNRFGVFLRVIMKLAQNRVEVKSEDNFKAEFLVILNHIKERCAAINSEI